MQKYLSLSLISESYKGLLHSSKYGVKVRFPNRKQSEYHKELLAHKKEIKSYINRHKKEYDEKITQKENEYIRKFEAEKTKMLITAEQKFRNQIIHIAHQTK